MGDVFLQKAGGPIGLRSTCAVARVVMNKWDSLWLEKMKENNVRIRRKNRYMDDIRSFLNRLKAGWRWHCGSLCFTEEWRNEDMKAGLSGTRVTETALVYSMNDVMPFLKFTTEVGEDFSDGKLPSLDTKIWVAEMRRIMYEFFNKPMATNLVVQANSALSTEVKCSSLEEEICRRLRNTSLDLDHSRRLEILEEACTNMKTSGHKDTFIRKVVYNGVKSFKNKVRMSNLPKDDPTYQPLHRSKGWRKNWRAKDKILKKKTWYLDKESKKDNHSGASNTRKPQKGGNKNKVSKPPARTATVVFVASKKGGILARKLRER